MCLYFFSVVFCDYPKALFCKHTTPTQIPRGHERISSRNPCSNYFPKHLYSSFYCWAYEWMLNSACYTWLQSKWTLTTLETTSKIKLYGKTENIRRKTLKHLRLCLKCNLKCQPPFARKVPFVVRKEWYVLNWHVSNFETLLSTLIQLIHTKVNEPIY